VLLVLGGATAFMIPGDQNWQLIAYFSLFGLVLGAALPLRAVAMSQWHGIAGFGTIMGIQTLLIAVFRAGAPPLVGALRDAGSGYGLPMLVLTVLFVAGSALILVSGRLRR
jgi:hypothetical protein